MASLDPGADTVNASLQALHADVGSTEAAAQQIADQDLTNFAWEIVESEFPDIFAAMQAEQANAKAFVALNIVSDVLAGVTGFAQTFQQQSNTILSVYTAAGDNALTPAQQQQIDGAMETLLTELTAQMTLVQLKSAGAQTLTAAINDPDGSFATGENAMRSKISDTQKNLDDLEAMANLPNNDPQAVAMGIMADNAIINILSGWLNSIEALPSLNSAMESALASDLIIWRTLHDKYSAVADNLKAASNDASILSAGDIRSAQLGWAQIETYVKSLV